MTKKYQYLDKVNFPSDVKKLKQSELKILAKEVREEMLDAVSVTGGHLGAGLGVVELTIALHYVFDTPNDKLIWDVGHQTYPHKILTGRKDKIRTLRQGNGLSGFTKRSESEYDTFGAAHSSTSISSALGIATANKLSKKSNQVIAVIGDGAISAGMSYEAMNNAGAAKTKMIVILNDNDMSIARPVGAMSTYLAKLLSGKIYFSFREIIKLIISAFSKKFIVKASKAEYFLRSAVTGGTLFNSLGFYYVGPIDGYNLDNLISVLQNAKNLNHEGPIMIHIKTKKGKGYEFAEKSLDRFHGVSKFNVKTGVQEKSKSNIPTYTKVFANTLIKHAEKDSKIIGITAAMPSGTGMDLFGEKFPKRMFDVGIAEQHAVTFAAGMATEGYKPYAAIYSTFLQRAYDHIVHDCAIQHLPVIFCMDRSGIAGEDGPTHHGALDIAYMRCIQEMIVTAPKSGNEFRHLLYTALNIKDQPFTIRYPKASSTEFDENGQAELLPIGSWDVEQRGSDVAILAVGPMVYTALDAAKQIASSGITCEVVNCRFIKPMDTAYLDSMKKKFTKIITLEEGTTTGGFGDGVAGWLLENGFQGQLKKLGLPDTFVEHGSRDQILAMLGLDLDGVSQSIRDWVGEKETVSV